MKRKGNTKKTKDIYIPIKINHIYSYMDKVLVINHKFNYGDKVLVISGGHINKRGIITDIIYNPKTDGWIYFFGENKEEAIGVDEECLELIKE